MPAEASSPQAGRVREVAQVAAMLADDSRVAMLDLLLDGQAHPVGELAQAAGIAPSTASEHLARLAAARLVCASRHGRRRLYSLAHPGVAGALEALSELTEVEESRGLRGWTRVELLREGRTCYDHLAGRLGVAVAEAAQAAGVFSADLQPQASAGEWLEHAGVKLNELEHGRRPLVRVCVDWTEKREHLAGAVGAALCGSFFARGWIVRRPGMRAVAVTAAGAEGFRHLGVQLDADAKR